MSSLLVDVEDELNMPGGVGFIDATDILEKGAREMAFGSILSIEGFELSDAMSALEIMDPRMDTGMAEEPPPFDPNRPLLPAEVCWILDRSFACEMSWHTGLALSQTVYTLRYVHHVGDITHPYFKVDDGTKLVEQSLAPENPERPLELVTLVLRASVFCLLKCCDLVWREVSRGHIVDGEDWSLEKYDVSLCENVPPESVLNLLDEAVTWVQGSSSLSSSWRDPLLRRLLMRKAILQALCSPSSPSTLRSAQEHLSAIMAGPSPPEPSGSVLSVFDPAIARRLISFVPTRIVELPLQSDVWQAIVMWLDQWDEVIQLIGTESLLSVKACQICHDWSLCWVLANLRAYGRYSPRRSTFMRSLSISTFFNGSKVLLTHDPPWLIDRFFLETAAVPPGIMSKLAAQSSEDDSDSSSSSSSLSSEGREDRQRDSGSAPSSRSTGCLDKNVELFEQGMARLLVDYFTSFYHNRARQRRKLASSLLDWHLGFTHTSDLVMSLTTPSFNSSLSRMPLCIRHVRLWVITEVVCSGFELELYARHEWTMIYWYLGQVLSSQVALLDELKASLLRGVDSLDAHSALAYVSVQRDYAWALRCFALAMRNLLYRFPPSKVHIDSPREQANFEKRFKWAFIAGYSEVDEDRPVFGKWRRWRDEQGLHEDGLNQVLDNLLHARDAFLRLSRCTSADTAAVFCEEAYKEFMLDLARACDANLSILQDSSEVVKAVIPVWKWEFSQWFPQIEISPPPSKNRPAPMDVD
ncbi:Mak10 subunit, NatC N-terminal acetyltransferase-domain-containing protein [Gautieria morchelliformis]|nr:Mak10 subunit, NatC N-terminal acetyltransferase-domain-containing protein [Gautieria morchelliformis]